MSFIVTPGVMLDHATALDGDVNRLATDVDASAAPQAFRDQWATFLSEWRAFYEGLQGVGGYVDRLWGGTDDQIASYRSRLVEWTAKFHKLGGDTTAPDAAPPEAPTNPLADLKWIVLGVAAVVALVIVARR
jgi:hypothetical protein